MTSTRKPTQTLNVKPSRVLSTLLLVALLALAAVPAQAGKPPAGGTTVITTNPLAELPGAKLLVDQDGWYRVSRQDLVDAGWDPGTSAAYLQLWADGQQQAILVNAGADGSLDPADTIEFYGTAIDTPWTGTRAYWLVKGSSQGLRIAQVSNSRGKLPPASFNDTTVISPKVVYVAGIANSVDGFWGDGVTTASVTKSISAVDLVTTGPASSLEVKLQGASIYDHYVDVRVNGNSVGSMGFVGQASLTWTFSVPTAWLVSGANSVTLTALNGASDTSTIVSMKLTYPRAYSAVNGVLDMTAPGSTAVTVARFATSSVRAFDITSPAAPQQLAVSVAAGAGSYAASFTTSSSRNAQSILAVSADGILAPVVLANAPSSLASTTNQADLVILAHPSMVAAAAPLASLRRQEGLLVTTVDVTDVYDTFNFGHKDPQAIKSFLQYTTSKWAKPPRYVLLLGNGSFDSRNRLDYGELDFVPTKLIALSGVLTASDDWLVDFDNDGLPNMAIGRIPARDTQEAETVVSKIVSYGQSSGTWTKSVLMASDKNSSSLDFEGAAASVASLIPAGFSIQKVSVGQLGASAAASAIASGIDAGQLVVNYSGHGFQQSWASPTILSTTSVSNLSNAAQLPFVVSMSCLTGYFHDPSRISLAASMVTAPNGGSIAFWGSTASPGLAGEVAVNQQLYRLLFSGSRPALGEAVAQAKAATSDDTVRRSWVFFGDPSMKLAM